METQVYSRPKLIWLNIFFFAVTTLVGTVGAFFYIKHFGFSWFLAGLTFFYMVATGMSITVGYHRLFSHATFKAHPIVRFLLLFFGAAAFEQSALEWSCQHRDHHRYVDTDRDPYSIKKGFFYAHMGWLMFWEHTTDLDNAHDLQKDPVIVHQFKNYHIWCIGSGLIVPVLIGALFHQALGAFIFAVCLRITLVYHSTFCINSICHVVGRSTYDPFSTAKDHWMVALITNGEGYHNFHHRFPSDYRNGVRWFDYDPSKWMIQFLSRVGLAWDLKEVSKFRILAARLHGENLRITQSFEDMNKHPAWNVKAQEMWRQRYEIIRRHLTEWQSQFEAQQAMVRERVSDSSFELRAIARKNTKEAKKRFKKAHESWNELVRRHPWDVHGLLLAGRA